jgi:hypothetical protein
MTSNSQRNPTTLGAGAVHDLVGKKLQCVADVRTPPRLRRRRLTFELHGNRNTALRSIFRIEDGRDAHMA